MAFGVAFIVAAAFFVESIFGFGGTLLSLAGLAFLLPAEHLTMVGLLVALTGATTIFVSSYKSVDWQQLKPLLWLSLPGLLVGTLLVSVVAAWWLFKLFALVLVVYGIQAIAWPKARLPERWSKAAVTLGGVVQGLFATGGPFVLLGWRDKFSSPQVLRATMAAFFCLTNCWRLVQLGLTGQLDSAVFIGYSWLIGVIFIAVWIGYYVHVRLSAEVFRRGVSALLLLAGVVLLFR